MTSGQHIRWGLCCQILDAPIAFRTATHAYVSKLNQGDQLAYLDHIALHNANALIDALRYCESLGIGAFRIQSQLFPLATHPVSGYAIDALPSAAEVRARLRTARAVAESRGIRLSFHPDQFVVLNSVRPEVVASAIEELEWQAQVAELVGADVICLHGGSTAGGRDGAIARLVDGIARLSPRVRERLALENDDRCYSVADLLPACLTTGLPLVLDAHHHRVLDGELSLEEATVWAMATWGDREPHFHLSSPRSQWAGGDPRPHADYIDPADVPGAWLDLGVPLTVDIEAKGKERAIIALRQSLLASTTNGPRIPRNDG